LEKFDFIDSRFRLALLAARRAKQLVNGSRKRVDASAENPLTTAIDEIFSGRIKYKTLTEDEMERLSSSFYNSTSTSETEEEEEEDDVLFIGEPESDSDSDSDELDLDDSAEDDDEE